MHASKWNSFVESHYEAIYRYCLQFLCSQVEAEDATQQTFVKAWKSFAKLNKPEAAKSWLYSIARHVCIDRLRAHRRSPILSELSDQKSQQKSDPALSLTLQQLIVELAQRQREVFILRHFHGFSTKETAKLLRISEGSVKSHLKRAVDFLRERLEEELGFQAKKEKISKESKSPKTTDPNQRPSIRVEEGTPP